MRVTTAAQMVDAMRSSGRVSSLHVTLCEMADPRISAIVKFDGVSRVLNVEHGKDSTLHLHTIGGHVR